MEGLTHRFLSTLLWPAHWLASEVGLTHRLPAVEVGVAILFCTTLFCLTLLCFIHALRTKHLILFVGSVVLLALAAVGLVATIAVADVWMYTLLIAIIGADSFWRMVSQAHYPLPLQRAATTIFIAFTLAGAGTAALIVVHGWWSDRSASEAAHQSLTAERSALFNEGLTNLKASLATISATSTLANADPSTATTLLAQASTSERVPYLVLLDAKQVVIARTIPNSAHGDTWLIATIPTNGDLASLSHTERGVPALFASTRLNSDRILVGAIMLDQAYLTSRASHINPLFTASNQGLLTLATTKGTMVNSLGAESFDHEIAHNAPVARTFSYADGDQRYIIATEPLTSADGSYVVSLGTAVEDTGARTRVRTDAIGILVLIVIAFGLPNTVRRKGGA